MPQSEVPVAGWGHGWCEMREPTRAPRSDELGGHSRVLRVRQRRPEFFARADTELCEYLTQVVLDSAGADEQLSADLWIRVPLCGQVGDLRLLRGELVKPLDRTFAHRLAGRRQLAPSALGKRCRTHLIERVVG